MSAPLQFDADLSRRIEATYTTADVAEQRRVLIDRLALRAGEDVLDITWSTRTCRVGSCGCSAASASQSRTVPLSPY